MKHIYEIYTKHPITGESGWEIKFVLSTPELIETFPHFDCVITIDDFMGNSLINWF